MENHVFSLQDMAANSSWNFIFKRWDCIFLCPLFVVVFYKDCLFIFNAGFILVNLTLWQKGNFKDFKNACKTLQSAYSRFMEMPVC
jgi:hypothetical protein